MKLNWLNTAAFLACVIRDYSHRQWLGPRIWRFMVKVQMPLISQLLMRLAWHATIPFLMETSAQPSW